MRPGIKRILKELIIILTAYIAFRSLFYIGYVPTASMEPTLHTGSFVLAAKLYPEIQTGDVIVFERDGVLLVKRVAYGSGEEIPVRHTADKDGTRMKMPSDGLNADEYLVVPEGCVYVLGDNQDNSYDSRYWDNPYVSMEDIRGLVILPRVNE